MPDVVLELSIIIISTAVLCVLAEVARQPLIVAYILAGFLVGPSGFGLIDANGFFSAISQVGIVLLLYLIGLELRPKRFVETLRRVSLPALFSTLSIIPFGWVIGWAGGLTLVETIYLIIAFLFSSTVVAIRMIHENGNVDRNVYDGCIGLLLLQDIIAVFVLVFINSTKNLYEIHIINYLVFFGYGLLIIAIAYLLQHFALRRIVRMVLHRTDLVFLLGLAWCFFFAELAEVFHLSREIGAFVAGLSLTSLPSHKLHVFVSKSETIRDFFMILFFFVLGAQLQLESLQVFSTVIIFSLVFVLIGKPLIYYLFFRLAKYTPGESKEIGFRLGQISEFSIIVAVLGASLGQIENEFSMAIKLILFISIIFSNYIVHYLPIKADKPFWFSPQGLLAKIRQDKQ